VCVVTFNDLLAHVSVVFAREQIFKMNITVVYTEYIE
jgi:hypothetical protein